MARSSRIFFRRRIGRGRGGDHALRPAPESQRELQVVPGEIRAAPLGELVAPGGVELGASEAVGVVGAEQLGHGAVVPDELVLGDLQLGALVGRIDRHQAGDALDHDGAHLGDGVADEGDAARAAVGQRRLADHLGAHPFGAGPRLARAASAEQQPRVPAASPFRQDGGELVVAGGDGPLVVDDAAELLRREMGGEEVEALRASGTFFQDAPQARGGTGPSRMRRRGRRGRCRSLRAVSSGLIAPVAVVLLPSAAGAGSEAISVT